MKIAIMKKGEETSAPENFGESASPGTPGITNATSTVKNHATTVAVVTSTTMYHVRVRTGPLANRRRRRRQGNPHRHSANARLVKTPTAMFGRKLVRNSLGEFDTKRACDVERTYSPNAATRQTMLGYNGHGPNSTWIGSVTMRLGTALPHHDRR
jgi:hypothetical protein